MIRPNEIRSEGRRTLIVGVNLKYFFTWVKRPFILFFILSYISPSSTLVWVVVCPIIDFALSSIVPPPLGEQRLRTYGCQMLPHSDSIHKEFVILNEIIFCPPPWRVFLESIEHVRRHKGEANYYLANNSGTPRHDGVKIFSSLLFSSMVVILLFRDGWGWKGLSSTSTSYETNTVRSCHD